GGNGGLAYGRRRHGRRTQADECARVVGRGRIAGRHVVVGRGVARVDRGGAAGDRTDHLTGDAVAGGSRSGLRQRETVVAVLRVVGGGVGRHRRARDGRLRVLAR